MFYLLILRIYSFTEFYDSIGIKALKRLSENRHPNPFWIFPFNKLDMRAKIYTSFDQSFAKEAKKSFSSYYKCFREYKHKRVSNLVNAYSEYLDAIDRVFDRSLNDDENCQRLIRILQRCQGINDSESVSSVFLCQFDEAFIPHITIWASLKAIFGF